MSTALRRSPRRLGEPRPRQPVFDTYWRLAAERQRIFHARARGVPGPWTDDPILRDWKFCNAYRASDRVSQYLIREVIYGAPELDAEDVLLRIVLFRLFSHPQTWETIEAASGARLTRETFDSQLLDEVLTQRLEAGTKLYTGAFILCANAAYGHRRKHRNHLALLEEMLDGGRLALEISTATGLRDVFETFRRYPLLGPFMAYQLAIDVNYSMVIDFDEDEFTVAGPGALRGIEKCFLDTAGRSPPDLIRWMTDRQAQELDRLEIDFEDLWGRPLHAIDCQNLFCETDKYARVAFPELRSERSRMKARFVADPTPLALCYPPSWRLARPA